MFGVSCASMRHTDAAVKGQLLVHFVQFLKYFYCYGPARPAGRPASPAQARACSSRPGPGWPGPRPGNMRITIGSVQNHLFQRPNTVGIHSPGLVHRVLITSAIIHHTDVAVKARPGIHFAVRHRWEWFATRDAIYDRGTGAKKYTRVTVGLYAVVSTPASVLSCLEPRWRFPKKLRAKLRQPFWDPEGGSKSAKKTGIFGHFWQKKWPKFGHFRGGGSKFGQRGGGGGELGTQLHVCFNGVLHECWKRQQRLSHYRFRAAIINAVPPNSLYAVMMKAIAASLVYQSVLLGMDVPCAYLLDTKSVLVYIVFSRGLWPRAILRWKRCSWLTQFWSEYLFEHIHAVILLIRYNMCLPEDILNNIVRLIN